MPAPRKVFRIEESVHFVARDPIPAVCGDDEASLRHHELMSALVDLRALLEQRRQPSPAPVPPGPDRVAHAHELKSELDLISEAIRRTKQDVGGLEANAFLGPQMARVGRELDAVIAGTEQATQNILKSAEDIDLIANTMSSMLKGTYELGLVQDLRDHVVRIFEACNFQDLTGQRIGKVIETLKFIEDHINRMLHIWRSIETVSPGSPLTASAANADSKFLNGPKLADDLGHSTQADIDVIFDAS